MSIVLTGGIVARSLDGPVEPADLVVSRGRIGGDARGTTVDVSGCLVVPGNVCAHHHLYSTLARGMPGPPETPRNFVEILKLVWWRLDRALDLEAIELSALVGAAEAVRAGTTSIVDHHASPEAIEGSLGTVADALAGAGLRGVVCYEVSDRHGEDAGRRAVTENARFLRTNQRPLLRGMMGAHASFTIGEANLEALTSEARDIGAPIHIHLAEDAWDEKHCLEAYGVRTAERLRRAGALGEGDLVAHGVWLDREEIALLRASGAWIAHNPRSNMNNGVGHAPVAEMGERVALGTDGIDGDMFAEARACYLRAREASNDATGSFALERLAAGTALVGSVFGEPALGTLDAGAPADLTVLEYRSPTPLEANNLAGHYLFGLGPWSVRDVMIGGRWVVRARRHQLVDEEELAARARVAARKVWDRMAEL